jgi:glycine cleavage system transcriptional repressor
VKRWFILSAIGQDRPGLVAELAQLVYDSDANLEDSRMTILGSDFAVILLASSVATGSGDRLLLGAKRLERDHGLTILVRALDGQPRGPVPAAGHAAWTLRAAGADKAGIVASLCRVLAEHAVNIADLATRSRPGEGGSPHYEMTMTVEIPERLDLELLRKALASEADRLVIDVELVPVSGGAER